MEWDGLLSGEGDYARLAALAGRRGPESMRGTFQARVAYWRRVCPPAGISHCFKSNWW